MITKEAAENGLTYGVIPLAMGVVSAMMPYVNTGLLCRGLIGVIQGVAARLVLHGTEVYMNKKEIKVAASWTIPLLCGTIIVGVGLTAVALFAISWLAVQAGVMSSAFSIQGLLSISLANFALSVGGFFLEIRLPDVLVKYEWVEEVKEQDQTLSPAQPHPS